MSGVCSVCVSLPGWDSVRQTSFHPGSVTDLSVCQALCACTSGTLGVSVQCPVGIPGQQAVAIALTPHLLSLSLAGRSHHVSGCHCVGSLV